MLKLAARCEQAAGPDRELDALIWCKLIGREFPEPPYTMRVERERYHPERGSFEQANKAGILLQSYKDNALAYTASLDAAITLVPEGHKWQVAQNDSDQSNRQWFAELRRGHMTSYSKAFPMWAATPALALCAAALRARSA